MRWGASILLAVVPLFAAFAADGGSAVTERGYNLLDPAEMVLAVDYSGTRFAWPLEYAQARQRVMTFLEEGDAESALAAARAQFIICPIDETSLTAAILSVSQAIEAAGNADRAAAFERFARSGPADISDPPDTTGHAADPLADVVAHFPERSDDYYAQLDAAVDARAAVSERWQGRWYETDKVFARLNGGRMDEALVILVPLLAESVRYIDRQSDDGATPQQNQDIMDRIEIALSVIYRSRTGTAAGVDSFIAACKAYALYGPAGPDGRMGTADDLRPPL